MSIISDGLYFPKMSPAISANKGRVFSTGVFLFLNSFFIALDPLYENVFLEPSENLGLFNLEDQDLADAVASLSAPNLLFK